MFQKKVLFNSEQISANIVDVSTSPYPCLAAIRANQNDEAVIFPGKNGSYFLPGMGDKFRIKALKRQCLYETGRREEWLDEPDPDIIKFRGVIDHGWGKTSLFFCFTSLSFSMPAIFDGGVGKPVGQTDSYRAFSIHVTLRALFKRTL